MSTDLLKLLPASLFAVLLLTGFGCAPQNPPMVSNTDTDPVLPTEMMTGTTSTSGTMMEGTETGENMTGEPIVAQAGAYIDYNSDKLALAKTGDVVLFFYASWCPTCQAADANFLKSTLPSGLFILKVDYDLSPELKKKYGVTYQHTFVQVDEKGNMIKKWSSSTRVNEVVAQVQ